MLFSWQYISGMCFIPCVYFENYTVYFGLDCTGLAAAWAAQFLREFAQKEQMCKIKTSSPKIHLTVRCWIVTSDAQRLSLSHTRHTHVLQQATACSTRAHDMVRGPRGGSALHNIELNHLAHTRAHSHSYWPTFITKVLSFLAAYF